MYNDQFQESGMLKDLEQLILEIVGRLRKISILLREWIT